MTLRPDEKAVLDAAIRWWHTKRPINFTEEKHMLCPAIKTATPAEKELCYAIADHLRHQEAMK